MIDFDVGKYGAFIWPAYAITALTFVVLIATALKAFDALKTEIFPKLLEEKGTKHEAHFYTDQGHVFTGLARLDATGRASAFLDRFLKA